MEDLMLDEERQLISARIPKALKHRLDIVAAVNQRQLQDIITEAVERYVSKLEHK